jgi:AbrB family looped-hinge helix DNA binding protein
VVLLATTLRGYSKVTSKGQITIPQDLRIEYDIKPGDTIFFLVNEKRELVLRKGPIKLS